MRRNLLAFFAVAILTLLFTMSASGQSQKSLDDFARVFLGQGGNTGPLIVTYTFDEVVRDLNQVMSYDWATFLHDRTEKINPHVDLAGIDRGGYKLVYADQPNPLEAALSGKEGAYFTGTDDHGVNVGIPLA